MYSKFSDEQKAMFLLQLEVLDYPKNEHALLEVSKPNGAPSRKTLRRWWRERHTSPEGKLAQQKKPDLVEALKTLLHLHIDAAMKAVQGSEDIRALDVGIGILVDKMQLLTGNPTERQEVHVTDHRERILAGIARKAEQLDAGDAIDIYPQPVA